MPSSAEAANFQALLLRLSALAVNAVSAMWRQTQGFADVEEAYPGILDPYAAAAATLSAQWYHDLDPAAPFAVEPAPLPVPEQLRANVGWAFTQQNPLTALHGSTERHVFHTSRDTIARNAKREKVAFARYASANACAWCRVLATRGAVYHSAEMAAKGHDGDHCIAVPVRGDDTYEPPDYVQQWEQEYLDARDAVGGNIDDIVNHMRQTSPTPGD